MDLVHRNTGPEGSPGSCDLWTGAAQLMDQYARLCYWGKKLLDPLVRHELHVTTDV